MDRAFGSAPNYVVIAGLDPAIHPVALLLGDKAAEWIPWSRHGMTTKTGSRQVLVRDLIKQAYAS